MLRLYACAAACRSSLLVHLTNRTSPWPSFLPLSLLPSWPAPPPSHRKSRPSSRPLWRRRATGIRWACTRWEAEKRSIPSPTCSPTSSTLMPPRRRTGAWPCLGGRVYGRPTRCVKRGVQRRVRRRVGQGISLTGFWPFCVGAGRRRGHLTCVAFAGRIWTWNALRWIPG